MQKATSLNNLWFGHGNQPDPWKLKTANAGEFSHPTILPWIKNRHLSRVWWLLLCWSAGVSGLQNRGVWLGYGWREGTYLLQGDHYGSQTVDSSYVCECAWCSYPDTRSCRFLLMYSLIAVKSDKAPAQKHTWVSKTFVWWWALSLLPYRRRGWGR